MTQSPGAEDRAKAVERIRVQAASGTVRVTEHAHVEMVEEKISLAEILEAANSAEILENYPTHKRGPCCLLHGVTAAWSQPARRLYDGEADAYHSNSV